MIKEEYISTNANISDCGQYRYCLSRVWDNTKPSVAFIMLNPSTADGQKDDATIRRCVGFAKSWGYGSLYVVNLFAFRSKEPTDLLKTMDPIGKENEDWLKQIQSLVHLTVCAWGNGKIVDKIFKNNEEYRPLQHFKNLNYIDLSKDGTPKHPLYLSKFLLPKKY